MYVNKKKKTTKLNFTDILFEISDNQLLPSAILTTFIYSLC